jgi:hypothetical protein
MTAPTTRAKPKKPLISGRHPDMTMPSREDERRSEARAAGRRNAQRRGLTVERAEAAPQIGQNPNGHSRAHAAGIDEFALIRVVAEQQRPEMRPRPFRVGPADDDELLAVQSFGFAPEAAVSRRIGGVDRLGDDALETELAGVLQDELAVSGIVAIELKAGLICDQRLEQRLALDERQARNVPAAKVQEIESEIDKMHAALAISSRLGLRKAGQSGIVDAAELAVDIGGLHVAVCERGDDARIFGRPVEPGPRQQLRTAMSMRAAIR